uniref:Secreted protein n=1 Tax=Onchocerca volvulus TaxID=6282 RepID=A0A8R1TZM2_ONCVO
MHSFLCVLVVLSMAYTSHRKTAPYPIALLLPLCSPPRAECERCDLMTCRFSTCKQKVPNMPAFVLRPTVSGRCLFAVSIQIQQIIVKSNIYEFKLNRCEKQTFGRGHFNVKRFVETADNQWLSLPREERGQFPRSIKNEILQTNRGQCRDHPIIRSLDRPCFLSPSTTNKKGGWMVKVPEVHAVGFCRHSSISSSGPEQNRLLQMAEGTTRNNRSQTELNTRKEIKESAEESGYTAISQSQFENEQRPEASNLLKGWRYVVRESIDR